MTETRLKELQTEIAKLKQTDKETNERVAAEFFERDIIELSKCTSVLCSKDLDMQMANESENIQ